MKANEADMTPTEAAGYIAGVSFGFVRRHNRVFAILLALGGLSLFLVGARLTITPTSFTASLGEGAFIGAPLIALSVMLWVLFRTPRK